MLFVFVYCESQYIMLSWFELPRDGQEATFFNLSI